MLSDVGHARAFEVNLAAVAEALNVFIPGSHDVLFMSAIYAADIPPSMAMVWPVM
jgi:hypothetical protein